MTIAIVGMAGCGKSVVTQYFVERHGFSKIYFGGIIVDAVRSLGLEANQKNEKKYREELRRQYGMAAVAIKAYDQIVGLRKKTDKVLLEGIYSWEEYVYLKERFPELVLISIWARPTIRYERLKHRAERPITTSDEARSRDIAEIVGTNKGGPIAIADFLVANEGTLDELHEKLDAVYQEIERGEYYHAANQSTAG